MTTSAQKFLIAWAVITGAGSVLNAVTWIVTGNVFSLAVCLFSAGVALYLIGDHE